jgi:hypothetical protein
MFLRNLQISIDTDSFTITDYYNEVPDGTPLTVRYALMGEWYSKAINFYPSATIMERVVETVSVGLIHPKRHMTIYTGGTPERVIVLEFDQPVADQSYTGSFNSESFYENRNFCCYPAYNHSTWSDGFLPYFLGAYISDEIFNHRQYESGFGYEDLRENRDFFSPDSPFSNPTIRIPDNPTPNSPPRDFTAY